MLAKLKFALKQSKTLSRSLLWQLLAKWQSRREPLSTIYTHEKLAAIKDYLKSDWEYIQIKREINMFKHEGIYDFAGIRLPACTLTPDYYLNVFKPHLKRIKYDRESIAKFYQEQKTKYPTVVYCKDVCVDGEPKYIGAHNVAHGFTYFCNEVVVHPNDIVFDLGAAPGDFSALAAYHGASKIYAFEPTESKKSDLSKLSAMNDNKIDIVRKFVGLKSDASLNLISLDDFVAEQKIVRVDFIKADIEGYEADMLRGSTQVLRTYKPKLTICSYHRENDAEELKNIIRSANEHYVIYEQPGVIYAY